MEFNTTLNDIFPVYLGDHLTIGRKHQSGTRNNTIDLLYHKTRPKIETNKIETFYSTPSRKIKAQVYLPKMMTRPFYFSMKGEEASRLFLFIVVCVQRNLHNKQKKLKLIVGAKRSTQGKAQLCRKVTDKQTFFHTMWYRSTPC